MVASTQCWRYNYYIEQRTERDNTMTDKTFTVAGVSTLNTQIKPRFANNMDRVKTLVRNGHTDIKLIELSKPMNKIDSVRELLTQTTLFNSDETAAMQAWLDKATGTVTAPAAEPTREDDEALLAELAAKTTPEPEPKLTLEQAMAQVPQRNAKGHFIKRTVREEMARELMQQ